MSIEVKELITVARYLPILIDTYPNTINQTNLSKKAEVTPAAVSQVKGVLQKICDLKSLAYERKLVLKLFEDNVWNQILFYNLVYEDLENFISYLKSKYFVDGLKDSFIFDFLSSKLGHSFNETFDETDVIFAISLIKDKVVYIYDEGKDDASIIIGDQSLDISTTTSSNVPYNVSYVISSLIDSDYSFIEKDQIVQFAQLRNKILEYMMLNSDKIYTLIKKIELWLDLSDEESSKIRDTYEILSQRIMTKIMFIVMRHVVGMKQMPTEMLKDL